MSINKGLENKNILISGASIAGPAVAYWLSQYGFKPTVVELAPSLRSGGYAVDFRGTTHLTVLKRMGILDKLRKLQTGGSPVSFIDQDGKELASLPAEFQGGDIEVLRSDLSKVLYDQSKDTTDYIFGDSITSLTETTEGVHVSFKKSPHELLIL
jgi:2-polyprenyl-6-methoxyphenol hydroxylase-like FAD-dependent oxidoreductase